jgi:hypothetical protein
METLLKDLHRSLRIFRGSPGFTVTAVTALALGIGAKAAIFPVVKTGAKAAIFPVVNTVLLRPVSAPEPEGVVVFLAANREGAGAIASDIKFNLWRQLTSVFQNVSAWHAGSSNVIGVEQPRRAGALFVTMDYFRLFGLSVALGRGLTTDEERPNSALAVIPGNAFWEGPRVRRGLGLNLFARASSMIQAHCFPNRRAKLDN